MNESTLPIGDHSKHEPIDLKSLRRIFNVPGDNPDKDNMIPYAEAAEAIKSALNSENPENALAYINR